MDFLAYSMLSISVDNIPFDFKDSKRTGSDNLLAVISHERIYSVGEV
jgi:hypothetical protein